jgi:hypothetical protein
VVAEDGDPGGRHVADRRAVIGELFVATGQAKEDLVPMRVRDVLESLDDQSIRLASFAQPEQLVDRPVTVGADQVARGMELDAGEAELPSEGGDRLVETFEVSEGEADRHATHMPRPATSTTRACSMRDSGLC